MSKVFKSKIFLGVICLVLAAVVAFLLLPRFYASKSNTTQAIKVTQDIPIGTVITNEMLVQVEVGAYGLPDNVPRSTENIVGMVASENLYTGEFLTSTRLLSETEYAALVAEQTKGLENGYCLVTVEFPQPPQVLPAFCAVVTLLMSTSVLKTRMTPSLWKKSLSPCTSMTCSTRIWNL